MSFKLQSTYQPKGDQPQAIEALVRGLSAGLKDQVLLGITGGLLLGEQIDSHFLSGRAFNIATIVHTYEAFLAS